MRIEDYALIGDLASAALVSSDGSVDWLCLPRFDSPSCFTALLGNDEHGHWRLSPAGDVTAVRRRYLPGTLVLETEFDTADGTVRITDFMPRRGADVPRLMRIVDGVRGTVPMKMTLAVRPDYGALVPWVEPGVDGAVVTAGPDTFRVATTVPLDIHDGTITAEFDIGVHSHERFTLCWYSSFDTPPMVEDADSALARTTQWWRAWSDRLHYAGPYRDEVLTSFLVLKAMTYEKTGAVIAAPTTSLPEDIGGVRNWDYRYCWLRDSVLTLEALLSGGYTDESAAFRDFLLRVGTGHPAALQIMYGIGGERRLTEFELPHLPGYEQSRPVRIGNAASEQFQLDVYGEMIGAAFFAAETLPKDSHALLWHRGRHLVDYVAEAWRDPDEGLWEVRGPRRHFTHSKVMAWVVFDRAVRFAEKFGAADAATRWRTIRDDIHADVCAHAFDPIRGTFTQYYGSDELDAATLMIPIVGFLPGTDPRVTGTIDVVRRELTREGLVSRYSTSHTDDGLPGGEGQFLACSFWLVSALALNGRIDEAHELFDRVAGLSNDLGLLAEEYDVDRRRLVGNFPQAFSHLALIDAAYTLAEAEGSGR